MSRVQLPDGGEAIIADFALESTAQMMLAQLAQLNGNKDWRLLVEHAKENAKDQETFHKSTLEHQKKLLGEFEDLADEVEKSNKKGTPLPAPTVGNAGPGPAKMGQAAEGAAASLDSFNKGAARGEKIFAGVYGATAAAIKGIATSIVVYGGILIDTFTGLGNELNEMTKVGVGFTDSVGQGGMSATSAMMSLSSMGIDAAGTLKNLSGVVQTMSKKSFVQFTESFMKATDSGVELGMSLDDSVERMGAELRKRQAMGVADGMNQARMNAQITKTIKTQQKYASVLGESVDEIVNFTDSLIQQTPVLTSSLLRMDRELRGKVISGITDFAGTMRAMGGEAGGDIAAAMTEAAASGQLGFSQSMVGYVTALPSLQGPMNNYIEAIKNGTLSQEDAEQMALDMTSQLGNLSKAEKDRIFLLDRAGNAQAASMAKAITQFEASAKKLKDLGPGLEMEGVQKGTNTLSKIMKEITGSFEGIKTGFLQGFGTVTDSGKGLSDTFEKMKKTVMDSISRTMGKFGLAGGVFEEMSGAGISLGEQLGERLPGYLETFAEYVGMAIEALPGIWEGIKSFINVMKTVGSILGVVMKVVSGAITIATNAFNALFSPIDAVASIFTKVEGETTGFLATLGKLAGLTGLVVLGFKAVSGVLGLFGKSMPAMFANMGKSLMSGAKNMMGKVTGGLSKATGGKLDGLFGKAKDKITGKSKEMDMGSKAMDTASKKSKSFTKTLSTGMKDISKGISSTLTNLSKGISNSVSNIATGIQKGISALSKGIADAGKGIGKGIGSLLQGTLTGLGKGLSALGKPNVLLGVTALIGIGAAMFVTGKAFQQFSDINWAGVAAGAVALGILGAAAFLIAPIAPLIGIGALAIGALGLALLPFAAAVKIAAPAMVELMGSFELLNGVDALNVALLGPALVSLAVGMAAFSAGGLVGGILDGLGSLLGQDSPFDKLAKIGAAAPAINEMTSNMGSFGTTVETFNDAMEQLDGAAIKGSFEEMAEGIDTLNASMAEISLVSIMKMAAMKSFGPVVEEPATEPTAPTEPTEPTEAQKPIGSGFLDFTESVFGKKEGAKTTPETPKPKPGDATRNAAAEIDTEEDPFAIPLEKAKEALNKAIAAQAKGIEEGIHSLDQDALNYDVQWAQMDLDAATKLDKEAAAKKDNSAEIKTPEKSKIDRSPAGRAQRRREAMNKKKEQLPEGQTSGTFENGKLVGPVAAKTNQPAQANVAMAAETPIDANKKAAEGTDDSSTKTESNKELFERMVKNQEQTNKLLKSGNRLTSDLSDDF
jgi:hypothetical protein